MTSPMYSSGVRTSTAMSGSRMTGFALRTASLKPIDPAILNAISDESTSCDGTVEEDRLDADHGVAGEHADVHRVLEALVDRARCTRAGCDHR